MSDYEIYVGIEEPFEADEYAIRLAAWHALRIAGMDDPVALTITLTTADAVHDLNREYAGMDSTTDVLSFPAEDEPYATEPGEPVYLGDTVIAVPVAEEQAIEAGHSLLAELQMLTVHGTLHLLGYDHGTPEDQAEMWALQSAALDNLRADEG